MYQTKWVAVLGCGEGFTGMVAYSSFNSSCCVLVCIIRPLQSRLCVYTSSKSQNKQTFCQTSNLSLLAKIFISFCFRRNCKSTEGGGFIPIVVYVMHHITGFCVYNIVLQYVKIFVFVLMLCTVSPVLLSTLNPTIPFSNRDCENAYFVVNDIGSLVFCFFISTSVFLINT